ncbi:hypothetical protein CAI21_20390 [Alkalilimnicola ehrlichii]|uniref:Lipid A biosynthesis acyltransferase n=1 Tax=Alkalilimnicola ehrlichii TaxID=351052 RepID=A0A3E0WJF6_9GAMM|nr:lysophospholipid acyltransferase family protein [Alkalilimnicola ehrlichii]RFA24765.1 hypothetical protein CAI21_20390 [Alkalilimnicola ehrlichii]RFA32005.1 hypothetical protein CAL65_20840 [Alkalilimnicola ehrlichii]
MPSIDKLLIVKVILRLAGYLPLPALHAIGFLLGSLFAAFPNDLRRDTRFNLKLCFPELSERERKRLLKHALRETFKAMTEVAAFWQWKPERLDALVKETRDLHVLYDAVEKGDGVIVAVPHLGAWELLPIYFSRRIPLHSLYRPPRNIEFDPLVRSARERLGGHTYPANPRGIRSLYKALSQGEVAAILPDQEPRGEGVFAPFFGVPAKTMTLLPKLAERSGAAVVYVFAIRLPWGRGYRIQCLPAPEGVSAADSTVAATAMNHGIEQCAQEALPQYQWSYRRFRKQPNGGKNRYKKQPR